MNTNLIEPLNGSVNVTIHKNYLKEDNSSYAKVQRTTAGMHNVIAAILAKTKVIALGRIVEGKHLLRDRRIDTFKIG